MFAEKYMIITYLIYSLFVFPMIIPIIRENTIDKIKKYINENEYAKE